MKELILHGYTAEDDDKKLLERAKEKLQYYDEYNEIFSLICEYGQKSNFKEHGLCSSDCSPYCCRRIKVHVRIETITESKSRSEN